MQWSEELHAEAVTYIDVGLFRDQGLRKRFAFGEVVHQSSVLQTKAKATWPHQIINDIAD